MKFLRELFITTIQYLIVGLCSVSGGAAYCVLSHYGYSGFYSMLAGFVVAGVLIGTLVHFKVLKTGVK